MTEKQSSRVLVTILVLIWLMGLLSSCDSPKSAPAPIPTATRLPQVLNVYNWPTYIDPAILTGFEQKFGVKVNYQEYTNNEEMLAAVQAKPGDHDVVVPENYMVTVLRHGGMLAPLNRENIPNFENVDPAFLNPAFDPGNRYCMPYQWGTIGVGYNIRATGRELHSWKDFFDDPAFAGRVSVQSHMRMALGAALLYLGYSPNTTSKAEIAAARDFLIAHSKQFATYAPETGEELLASGQVDLAFEYVGDILQVAADNPDIRYMLPEEGAIIWTDSMCIPASSPHKELAEVFINYVLDPQVGAALSNFTHYGTPNQAALSNINRDDRENPALYPTAEVRWRLFYVTDVGEATRLYEQAWAEVMAQHNP